MNWYYSFLVRRPFCMVVAIGILSLACIIVALTAKLLPNFDNPTEGFESRGTVISERLTAWRNLKDKSGPSGELVANPNDLYPLNADLNSKPFKKIRKKNGHKRKNQNAKTTNDFHNNIQILRNYSKIGALSISPDVFLDNKGVVKDYEQFSSDSYRQPESHWEYGRNKSFVDEENKKEDIKLVKEKWKSLGKLEPPIIRNDDDYSSGYFCGGPMKEFSHFVVQRIGPNSSTTMFDINALLAMCQLEQQITSVKNYDQYCQKEMKFDKCCRPWSLPNYVALLSNKISCFDINIDDVLLVEKLLLNCFNYYHNLKLSNNCNEARCYAPAECTKNNAVFNILHYLTDIDFFQSNDSSVFLNYAMIFIPVAQGSKVLPLYYDLEKTDLRNELVKIVAIDMDLRYALFDERLLLDGWLIALGGVFVMACMWLYTSSLFITIMTDIAVLFSIGLAYFIYTLVFEMSFFPFMNLLAVVVIIGVGADDAFIFVKIWHCILEERLTKVSSTVSPSNSFSEPAYTETLHSLMATTVRHASLSMFVTSFTTAGAFYASYFSSITAVKCFGIFAGTAIITNYLLMITWLPASISIMERIPFNCETYFSRAILQKLYKSMNKIGSKLEICIINTVLNLPLFWVISLGLIGICSSVIVLYWPRLRLPETNEFQLFVSTHPFELYENKYKEMFRFEKVISTTNFKLPLRFVWGILPIDDGDFFNPHSRGELHFDNNFNMSSIESQTWLFQFCEHLKQQSFYQPSLGSLLPNCYIDNFISHMSRICIDSMDGTDRTPCCEISKFPYKPHIFEECLPPSISSLYATPREFFYPGVAGPKFMAQSVQSHPNEIINKTFIPIARALVVEFESVFAFSMSYGKMKEFVQIVETWFQVELKSAPPEMRNGWFISELEFYDLQDTLSKGTLIAIGMAMMASLLVLLLVTLNVLISLYAVVTVTFTIFTTVAVLILMGWKLNILESVAVSTAIGLAVDFSLHYGIHYRMSPNGDRLSATNFALSRIIGPTAMAAITTGVAGALMIFSNVLPYIQIGIFLAVVMSISWIYATFFLISLLRIIGPEHNFMQFKYPNFKRQKKNGNTFYDRKPSQVVATEQLLTPSNSAVGDLMNNSESHELDSLTSNSLIKPIAECSRPPFNYERAFKITSTSLKDNQTPPSGSPTTVILPYDSVMKV